MCEVLDQIENKGFEKGYQKGFQESILKGKKQIVLSVYAAGLSEEFIVNALKLNCALIKD